MELSIESLQEVVIVGCATQKKVTMTGTVSGNITKFPNNHGLNNGVVGAYFSLINLGSSGNVSIIVKNPRSISFIFIKPSPRISSGLILK